MAHDGVVDVDDLGQYVVERPTAVDDVWWDQVQQHLMGAALAHAGERVIVSRAKTRVLRQLLGSGVAAGAVWTWSRRALGAEAADARVSTRLGELSTISVEEQTRWPPGLDLGDAGFTRELRPFQRHAVARLLRASGGADFSVPGAGKTTVAYAAFCGLRAQGLVHAMLVVAPTSAFDAWVEEADACFAPAHRPELRVRPRHPRDSDVVLVTNYERLADARVVGDLREWARNRKVLIVFDEAHRGKAGARSRRGANAARLARESEATLVLTGTPMPNGESDLAAVFDLAWPGHGERLVDGELAHLRERVFVRVTKQDLELPPLEIRVERVELDPIHRRLYDAMTNRVGSWAAETEPTAVEAGRALMHLLAAGTNPSTVFDPDAPWTLPLTAVEGADLTEVVGSPGEHIRPAKIVRAAQIVADNRKQGKKTLVWTSFVGNVKALAVALAHHDPAVVVGATPIDEPSAPTDRRRELRRFRDDPECWVLVATPQTLGEGVSLHKVCTDQVHADRGFSASTWLQSIDRTHRLGLPQDARATCIVLQAARTIDERVAEVLDKKVRAMAAALDDRSLHPVADPMIVEEDPVAGILGDVDTLRELLGLG